MFRVKLDRRWWEVVLATPTEEGELPSFEDEEGRWTVHEVIFGFWPPDSYRPGKLPQTKLLWAAILEAVQNVYDQYGLEAVLGSESNDR